MTEPINVLVTLSLSEDLIKKLAQVSPRLSIIQQEAHSPEEVADILGEIEILYTWDVFPEPGDAPHLRWVQMHLAGVDQILEHPLFTSSDVIFTTVSGIHATSMAEYVLGQMLAFGHRFLRMMEDKASATWPEGRWKRYVPDELRGATVGIVGYGSVGREVARLAQAFGMRVLAVKRDVRNLASDDYTLPGTGDPEGDIPDRIYPPQALRSFLKECDYVVLTVPLTPETRHMINADALAAMKSDAILINVARGEVVDEEALISALQEGTIGGAALDVYSQEPLPPESPLWALPNVIMSPHVSGFSPHYNERSVELFAENLRRFLAGEELINVVDRKRGY